MARLHVARDANRTPRPRPGPSLPLVVHKHGIEFGIAARVEIRRVCRRVQLVCAVSKARTKQRAEAKGHGAVLLVQPLLSHFIATLQQKHALGVFALLLQHPGLVHLQREAIQDARRVGRQLYASIQKRVSARE